MRLLAIVVAAAALVSACATATPYQPAARAGGYGFAETRIEPNRVRLSVRGNSVTDREIVEAQLLYRAAETTLAAGYDHFIVAARATDADRRTTSFGSPRFSPYGFYPEFWYYHRGFGWRGAYDPFWNDWDTREIVRFEATAEIAMFKGPKPAGDANAFDAREVKANLEAKIIRPQPQT